MTPSVSRASLIAHSAAALTSVFGTGVSRRPDRACVIREYRTEFASRPQLSTADYLRNGANARVRHIKACVLVTAGAEESSSRLRIVIPAYAVVSSAYLACGGHPNFPYWQHTYPNVASRGYFEQRLRTEIDHCLSEPQPDYGQRYLSYGFD